MGMHPLTIFLSLLFSSGGEWFRFVSSAVMGKETYQVSALKQEGIEATHINILVMAILGCQLGYIWN